MLKIIIAIVTLSSFNLLAEPTPYGVGIVQQETPIFGERLSVLFEKDGQLHYRRCQQGADVIENCQGLTGDLDDFNIPFERYTQFLSLSMKRFYSDVIIPASKRVDLNRVEIDKTDKELAAVNAKIKELKERVSDPETSDSERQHFTVLIQREQETKKTLESKRAHWVKSLESTENYLATSEKCQAKADNWISTLIAQLKDHGRYYNTDRAPCPGQMAQAFGESLDRHSFNVRNLVLLLDTGFSYTAAVRVSGVNTRINPELYDLFQRASPWEFFPNSEKRKRLPRWIALGIDHGLYAQWLKEQCGDRCENEIESFRYPMRMGAPINNGQFVYRTLPLIKAISDNHKTFLIYDVHALIEADPSFITGAQKFTGQFKIMPKHLLEVIEHQAAANVFKEFLYVGCTGDPRDGCAP